MPKKKSLLKKIEVEVARKKRTCKHTRCAIPMGRSCLVVFDGPRKRFCYSKEVALKMIAEARAQLEAVENQLANDEE